MLEVELIWIVSLYSGITVLASVAQCLKTIVPHIMSGLQVCEDESQVWGRGEVSEAPATGTDFQGVTKYSVMG